MKVKYTVYLSTIITILIVILLSLYYFKDLERATEIPKALTDLKINPHSETTTNSQEKIEIITVQKTLNTEEKTYQSIIMPITKSTIISSANGLIYDNGKKYGQAINKGDIIIRINSTEAKNELLTQVVNYITAKDTYQSNKYNVEKNNELLKKGIISKRENEESESTFMKSLISFIKARVQFKEIAESLSFDWQKIDQLDLSEQPFFEKGNSEQIIELLLNKDYILNLDAKDSGVFLPHINDNNTTDSINTSKGHSIKKNQIIGIIADQKKVQLSINVPEFDAIKFQKGQPANVSISALNEKKLTGEVVDIKKFEYKTQQGQEPTIPIIVHAKCDTTCDYLYAMSSEVTILKDPKNSILVPISAVKKIENQEFVMVLKNNEYIKTPVTVGLTTIDSITITKGLEQGDQIVKNYPGE